MSAELNVDQLIETAMMQTGRSDFGGDSYREGLEVLVADVNADAKADGRPAALMERMRADLVMNLRQRLKTTDYLKTYPELTERPIEKPVFVFGIPRTGTTLLSNLLACDPARRSPLAWEIDEPYPPVQPGMLHTDPRALKKLEREKMMLQMMPEMGKYYRMSAIYPNECIFFMSHDFKALQFESRGKLLGYRDWLFSCDMTSAYEYHKKFLQLLQHHVSGIWNLKMPSHALWLDTIKQIYPDARFVWTHRDPYTALGSFCSIISLGNRGFTGNADLEAIGQNCSYQAQLHVDRIMDYREANGEDSIVDLHYAQLTDNPIETMRSLYAALGDDFTPEAEAAMQAWIDDNPQNKFGKHDYKLDQFGLTKEGADPLFERYLAKYDVAMNG